LGNHHADGRVYRAALVFHPAGAHERLLRLAGLSDQANSDLIAEPLKRY
jgi:hypothetical protein